MLKKDITYTNPFTDQEATETHYFHISKADLVEMEMEEHKLAYTAKDGQDYTGMQAKFKRIMDSEDGKDILTVLKDVIRRSYGQKIGDRFLKSPETTAEFMASEAFSQLLFELCTDAEKAAEFTNGVIPGNLAAEAAAIAQQSADISDQEEAATVTQLHEMSPSASTDNPRVLTQAEVITMDSDELRSGLAEGRYKLS